MLSEQFWQAAQSIIATPTSIEYGNSRIELLLNQLLEPLSPRVNVQRVHFAGNPHINFLASFGPQQEGGLLLVTHSDTVPAGPTHLWTKGHPYQLTRTKDQVIGLGVADVKLDLICKIFALRQLDLTRLKKPLHLLATYGEEVGLVGAKNFIKSNMIQPEWVLCGEPSELIPCHAHKGYAVIKVTIRSEKPKKIQISESTQQWQLTSLGKAAHSSTPHLGINAIVQLTEFLSQYRRLFALLDIQGGTSSNTVPAQAQAFIRCTSEQRQNIEIHLLDQQQKFQLHTSLKKEQTEEEYDINDNLALLSHLWQHWCNLSQKLQPLTHDIFSPSHVVNNWGQINSDQNTISAVFDARLLPAHDPDVLLTQFQDSITKIQHPEHIVDVKIERDNAGMYLAENSPLLSTLSQILKAKNLPYQARAKPTSTEAGVFFRAGFPAAVFGPGVSTGNAHTANEWNRVGDLELAVDIYQQLIQELCMNV